MPASALPPDPKNKVEQNLWHLLLYIILLLLFLDGVGMLWKHPEFFQ
jgi:hypothetical protein